MKAVEDVVYLSDIDERPIKSLPITYDLQVEHIEDDASTISFQVPIEEPVNVEQQIIYRKKRYIITEVEESRISQKTAIVGESYFITLNYSFIPYLEIDGVSLIDGATTILDGTEWSIGEVPYDERLYFLTEERQTPLYCLRKLIDGTGYLLKFDTINKIVHIVEENSNSNVKTVFRYKKNTSKIKRIRQSPQATVMYPYGRGDLSIASINEGQEFIEDYSWYTSLGLTESQARERFKKETIWKDERFIYQGNLMRAAQQRLRLLSHPQITYEVEATVLSHPLDISEEGYVIDDDLGIKVKTRVVRLVEYEDKSRNKYEFNYLIPSLETQELQDTSLGMTGTQDAVLIKNTEDITLDNSQYRPVLSLAFATYAPTNAQYGIYLVAECSEDLVLDGYFELDGEPIGPVFKHNAQQGWNTISFSFILPNLENGSMLYEFLLKTSIGTLTIAEGQAEMYMKAENLLGGRDRPQGPPRANVSDTVDLSVVELISASDNVHVSVEPYDFGVWLREAFNQDNVVSQYSSSNRTNGTKIIMNETYTINTMRIFGRDPIDYTVHIWDVETQSIIASTVITTSERDTWGETALGEEITLIEGKEYILSYNHDTSKSYYGNHIRSEDAPSQFLKKATFVEGCYANGHDTFPSTRDSSYAYGIVDAGYL